jgi:segregation and condensation protein B
MFHPLRRPSACERPILRRPINHRLPLAWRSEPDEPADAAGALARDRPLALVEAALLLADEPLPARRLAVLAGLSDAAQARHLVMRLRELYDKGGSAFQVEELAGGYQLLSKAEFHPWLARLRQSAPEIQLTPAARETLAIVAYRQPVTRADVESIRGVGVSDVLKQLMEKGLIKLAGRDDSLGRPALYETTRKFLQLFGLKSLRDLPPVEGLSGPAKKKKAAPEGEQDGGHTGQSED